MSYQAPATPIEVTNSELSLVELVTGHEHVQYYCTIGEQVLDTAAGTLKMQGNDHHDYGLTNSVDLFERFIELAPAENYDQQAAGLPKMQEECCCSNVSVDQVQPIQETGVANGGDEIVTGFEIVLPGD